MVLLDRISRIYTISLGFTRRTVKHRTLVRIAGNISGLLHFETQHGLVCSSLSPLIAYRVQGRRSVQFSGQRVGRGLSGYDKYRVSVSRCVRQPYRRHRS